jgi:hypothetical protein
LPVTVPKEHFVSATFCEAALPINAATGMTFMTAARGIDALLTQNPMHRMRLPVNASIRPVNTPHLEPREAD